MPFQPKLCKTCEHEFVPNSGRQEKCDECRGVSRNGRPAKPATTPAEAASLIDRISADADAEMARINEKIAVAHRQAEEKVAAVLRARDELVHNLDAERKAAERVQQAVAAV